MQEWLNWPLSKSGKVKAFEGSNPSLSAMDIVQLFVLLLASRQESVTLSWAAEAIKQTAGLGGQVAYRELFRYSRKQYDEMGITSTRFSFTPWLHDC